MRIILFLTTFSSSLNAYAQALSSTRYRVIPVVYIEEDLRLMGKNFHRE